MLIQVFVVASLAGLGGGLLAVAFCAWVYKVRSLQDVIP